MLVAAVGVQSACLGAVLAFFSAVEMRSGCSGLVKAPPYANRADSISAGGRIAPEPKKKLTAVEIAQAKIRKLELDKEPKPPQAKFSTMRNSAQRRSTTEELWSTGRSSSRSAVIAGGGCHWTEYGNRG